MTDPLLRVHTRVFGIDCEMAMGIDGSKVLVRAAVVDAMGRVLVDALCRPSIPVIDYLTSIHGLTPQDIDGAELSFKELIDRLHRILLGEDGTLSCTIVGHNVDHDLRALQLDNQVHSRLVRVRDTAKFILFQKFRPYTCRLLQRKLKEVVYEVTGIVIQRDQHNPCEDACASLLLYMCVCSLWEHQLQRRGSMEPTFHVTPIHRRVISTSSSAIPLESTVYLCSLDLPFMQYAITSFGVTAENARINALAMGWTVIMKRYFRECVPRAKLIACEYLRTTFHHVFTNVGRFATDADKDKDRVQDKRQHVECTS